MGFSKIGTLMGLTHREYQSSNFILLEYYIDSSKSFALLYNISNQLVDIHLLGF